MKTEQRYPDLALWGFCSAVTGKLINPVHFSSHFKLEPSRLDDAGLFDPVLNCDTALFIDPLLIRTSATDLISTVGYEALRKRFGEVVRLVAISEKHNDPGWTAAVRHLDLSERPETCLGFGAGSIGGNSRPKELKEKILRTTAEIIRLGEKDPEMISLMAMFEDGVGPDTISDLTTTAIFPALAELTQQFAEANGIPVQTFPRYGAARLPANPARSGTPVLLVPKDILRNLPLAADWSDVSEVAFANATIRASFNEFVGEITKATLGDKKHAMKQAALSSLENFRAIFEAVLSGSTNYDPNEDILGFYAFRQLLTGHLSAFAGKITPPTAQTKSELMRIVGEIIAHFRRMVEENNLWEMLWHGNRPRKERAAQLLFFAVADSYCRANNIDISPEMNPGGGPVDFKFSSGYENRVLVELKMSSGAVVHGFKKQLEVYKSASSTDAAYFLVIEIGDWDKKYEDITAHRNIAVMAGEPASVIEVVDARRKLSASKRPF